MVGLQRQSVYIALIELLKLKLSSISARGLSQQGGGKGIILHSSCKVVERQFGEMAGGGARERGWDLEKGQKRGVFGGFLDQLADKVGQMRGGVVEIICGVGNGLQMGEHGEMQNAEVEHGADEVGGCAVVEVVEARGRDGVSGGGGETKGVIGLAECG